MESLFEIVQKRWPKLAERDLQVDAISLNDEAAQEHNFIKKLRALGFTDPDDDTVKIIVVHQYEICDYLNGRGPFCNCEPTLLDEKGEKLA